MAIAIPTLPMSGESLKTSLDGLRQHLVPHVTSLTGLGSLANLVEGDCCVTPDGTFEITSTHGTSINGQTVVDVLAPGLQAVMLYDGMVLDVDAVFADTRLPSCFPEGAIFTTRTEGFTYRVAAAAATDHHIVTAGGTKLYVEHNAEGFNVKAFGAKGDGVADDSTAISTAVRAAIEASKTPLVGSNIIALAAIYFPGGEYRVTAPRTLLWGAGLGRKVGLRWYGENNGTTIHFDYDGDDYLFYNDNEFLILSFENLRFACNSDLSKFAYSTGNGGAQDISFERCMWAGVWQKLLVLRGVNNNSEWKWTNSAITAAIRDVALDIQDSDQFLNYWFVNCKLWLYDGQMIRATHGGHFHFTNCDASGLEPPMTLNQSTNGAPFFELLGRSHARGVCVLALHSCRFEHKNLLSKLLYCEWNQGTVAFRDTDFSSNWDSSFNTQETAIFDSGNTPGPEVTFDNCQLIGKHKYITATSGFGHPKTAKYTQCSVYQDNPSAFIELETVGNAGASWQVALDHCRSMTQSNSSIAITAWDAVIGARRAMSSHAGTRSFIFRNPQGNGTNLNASPLQVRVPDGALITRVTFRSSGVLSSNNLVNFRVTDGATTPIAETGDVLLRHAWAFDIPCAFAVPAGQELLELLDANGLANQSSNEVFAEVEFIA